MKCCLMLFASLFNPSLHLKWSLYILKSFSPNFIASLSRRGIGPIGKFSFKEESPLVLTHSNDYTRLRESGIHFRLFYRVELDDVFPLLADGSKERFGTCKSIYGPGSCSVADC